MERNIAADVRRLCATWISSSSGREMRGSGERENFKSNGKCPKIDKARVKSSPITEMNGSKIEKDHGAFALQISYKDDERGGVIALS